MYKSQHESTTDTLQIGPYESLGMMVWMMSHAEYHSQWPLWSLENDILPPLLHGQYKLYLDEQQNPIGFVTWAWLTEKAREIVLTGEAVHDFEAWSAGSNLLLNDFIAPWGHAKLIIEQIRSFVFPDQKCFGLRRNPDGSIRKVYLGHGHKKDLKRGQSGEKKNSAGADTPAE